MGQKAVQLCGHTVQSVFSRTILTEQNKHWQRCVHVLLAEYTTRTGFLQLKKQINELLANCSKFVLFKDNKGHYILFLWVRTALIRWFRPADDEYEYEARRMLNMESPERRTRDAVKKNLFEEDFGRNWSRRFAVETKEPSSCRCRYLRIKKLEYQS